MSSSRHIIVDCEACPVEEECVPGVKVLGLKLWCATWFQIKSGEVVKERKAFGRKATEFWDWASSQLDKRSNTFIWAHNAIVDITWLEWFKLVASKRFTRALTILETPPLICKGLLDGKKCTIADSQNWLRRRLEDVAAWVKLPYVMLPHDEAPEEHWIERCENDVLVLATAIKRLAKWVDEIGAGGLCPTVPMQAMRAWRKWGECPRPVPHGLESVQKLEREAYYGGICLLGFQGIVYSGKPDDSIKGLCKRKGSSLLSNTMAHVLDIRSYYPSIMQSLSAPYRYVRSFETISLSVLRLLLYDYEVIARVKIKSTSTLYPRRRNAVTEYATGTFWTVLAGPELRLAATQGELLEVQDCAIYKKGPVFREFVEHLWPLRRQMIENGDEIGNAYVKLMLNSLYGKFGQRSGGWIDQEYIPAPKMKNKKGYFFTGFKGVCDANGVMSFGSFYDINCETNVVSECRVLDGVVQVKEEKGENPNSFVAIPACVTSAGRVKLLSIIRCLLPHQLLYCDTDCVHVTDDGLKRLRQHGKVTGEMLGGLQLIGSYDYAEYVQRKVYRIGDKWVISGRKKESNQVGDWEYIQEHWDRLCDILERGPDGHIHIRTHLHSIRRTYECGTKDKDGWCSQPNIQDIYWMSENDDDPALGSES